MNAVSGVAVVSALLQLQCCTVCVAHLVQAVKMVLHALDGNILAILDALCLQHLAESALTLLGHKPVLCAQTKQPELLVIILQNAAAHWSTVLNGSHSSRCAGADVLTVHGWSPSAEVEAEGVKLYSQVSCVKLTLNTCVGPCCSDSPDFCLAM